MSRSLSKVSVIGQSSRSQDENVVKVVGATSSEGFLVFPSTVNVENCHIGVLGIVSARHAFYARK